MIVLAVGLNHRTAPLEVREQVAVSKEGLKEALACLMEQTGDGVILSTCNRTEVYTLCRDASAGAGAVRDFLVSYHHIPEDQLWPYLYTLEHGDAIYHLFRVACSLDSLILGESQILGQVRNAFTAAVNVGAARGALSRLFHQALRVGKRARQETGIGRNALSVSYACVELARHILGDLRDATVLLVGVGDAGKLASQALVNSGVSQVCVTNRTYWRSQDMAQELGAVALPFDQLEETLGHVDIVISCTGSPGYIITADACRSAVHHRNSNPLFLMDIAVPRDIDPAVADIPGVHLYDIDDLEAVSESNRLERQQEAAKVEAIIGEETSGFLRWWDSLSVVPTIATLRQRAEEIRQREVARALRRLPDLDEEEQQRIEAMSRAIVKKLLHHPITSLRERRDMEDARSLHRLFKLGPGER